jgi:diadenosine tetraphosphate (Ap4A) HIT family hydrolase
MLFPDRHNEGVWDLGEKEAAQFGLLLVALTRAVKQACGAERVYAMYAGENALHFHAMVMPRGPEVPAEWRGGALIGKHKELTDAQETDRMLGVLRELIGSQPLR